MDGEYHNFHNTFVLLTAHLSVSYYVHNITFIFLFKLNNCSDSRMFCKGNNMFTFTNSRCHFIIIVKWNLHFNL